MFADISKITFKFKDSDIIKQKQSKKNAKIETN